jgi:hypothetical protein
MNQFLVVAAAEKIAALLTEDYVTREARHQDSRLSTKRGDDLYARPLHGLPDRPGLRSSQPRRPGTYI